MEHQPNLNALHEYMINNRWPAKHKHAIQLYSLPTPNGQKVSIMLEETGLSYEAHRIPFGDEGTQSVEFLSLNPNNKIPAIIDPNGPGGKPLSLFESGAILIYLAKKSGKFLGQCESEEYEIIQWLMFQMGGVGPMFGQLGFFHAFDGKKMKDKLPRDRYAEEVKRLLRVINHRLSEREWLVNDYSIADMAVGPWLNALLNSYDATDITNLDEQENVLAYIDRFNAREAVLRGKTIPSL